MATSDASWNWVKARAECSLYQVFKALEIGVREDVETKISLLTQRDETKFSITSSSKHFSVIRVDNLMTMIGRSVDFRCGTDDISVYASTNSGERLILTATVGLDNEGQCKLRMDGALFDQWQIRRMALDELLFGPSDR
jgi:hypothetical protein